MIELNLRSFIEPDLRSFIELNPHAYRYTLPGKPIPLQRPRFAMKQVYDSQKREKSIAGIYLNTQHNEHPFLEGPLKLTALFYFETPKKTKSLNRRAHFSRPDLDNLIKWICDVSNGIIFKDDSQIALITALKAYDNTPRTEFTVEQIKI